MSNPIDNKKIKIDNSISNLVFLWKAKFLNGDILYQENGTSFQEVKNRFHELIEFSIHSKNLQKSFFVDLINGNVSESRIYSENEEKKSNIRLIYFRRNTLESGINDLKEQNHIIRYFIGYQYLDKNEINRQVILEVNADGTFIIRS